MSTCLDVSSHRLLIIHCSNIQIDPNVMSFTYVCHKIEIIFRLEVRSSNRQILNIFADFPSEKVRLEMRRRIGREHIWKISHRRGNQKEICFAFLYGLVLFLWSAIYPCATILYSHTQTTTVGYGKIRFKFEIPTLHTSNALQPIPEWNYNGYGC